jgi:Protein of unknown function (DUF2934)
MLKDPSVKSAPGKPTEVKPTAARSAPAEAKSGEAKAGRSTVVAKTAPTRATARTAARKSSVGRPMDDLERRIQQRAYELWENEGRPHGREQDHWQQAEREIAGRSASNAA